jgi:hypothetical protein
MAFGYVAVAERMCLLLRRRYVGGPSSVGDLFGGEINALDNCKGVWGGLDW